MGANLNVGLFLLALIFAFVSLGSGKYRQLCSIRQARDDCLIKAKKYSGGIGGWQKQDSDKLDAYLAEIVTDVGKIMKKCDFGKRKLLTTNVNEVYTQVVAGLNICMSANLSYSQCDENQSVPCASQSTRCSILAYKPPSKEPLQDSDVSIYCD